MRVGIATDHGGFGLKEELVAHPRAAGQNESSRQSRQFLNSPKHAWYSQLIRRRFSESYYKFGQRTLGLFALFHAAVDG
jgi:hypothetical protein